MNSIRFAALFAFAGAVGAQGPAPGWVFLDGAPETIGGGVVRQKNGRHVLAGPRGSVFEIDDGKWLQRPAGNGPSHRLLASYCYDSTRDLVYLFGGRADGVFQNDLWVWDGISWADVTPANGPSPRWEAQMAYDVFRDRIVLFGGRQQASIDDTWEFDGTNWHAMSPTGNLPANGKAMTYDLQRAECVLLAQNANIFQPGGTWTWDGASWTLVTSVGPSGSASAMDYDIGRDVTVLMGGNPVSDEVWEWNGSSWTQVATLTNAARSRPSVSYDPVHGGVRLFGGQTILQGTFTMHLSQRTDSWLWDGATMQQMHDDLRPPSRWSSTFVFDPFRAELLMFGGQIGLSFFDDTWTFDGERWTRHQPTGGPNARRDAATAANHGTGHVLMFGGFGSGSAHDDLWSWDGSWSQVPVAGVGPSPRQSMGLASDPVAGAWLFGGRSSGGYLDDLWFTDEQTWTLVEDDGPPPREYPALLVEPATGDVLVWGGRDGATLADQKNDFWRFSNGAWQQVVTATTPPPMHYVRLSLDPGPGSLLLTGTPAGGGLEQWSFDGVDWSLMHADTDPVAQGPSVRNETDSRLYVYTGQALMTFAEAPAVAENLGGSCGTNAPRIELRTRPRIGSSEFGFDLQTTSNDIVFFCLADQTGTLPFGGCTVLLSPSFVPVLGFADPAGRATQGLPLPFDPALRGQDFFVHGSSWNVSQPLTALRFSDAWRFLIGD